jgi:hypothetical protein
MCRPHRTFLSTLAIAATVLASHGSVMTAQDIEYVGRQFYALDNGDVNGDFQRDVSDPIYLLAHLYAGGPEPMPLAICVGAARVVKNGDSNGDGALDVSDGIHLLGWLFANGLEPFDVCNAPLDLGEGGRSSQANPRIAPVQSRPNGKSYGEWSEAFWQWNLAIPADENPGFTGNCTAPQEGNVWFIVAAFGAEAACTVPTGKSIFFPLVGTENDYPCPDPNFQPAPGQSLEDFLTEGVQAFMDQVTNVELWIDGVSAGDMLGQRVTSDMFTFTGDPSLTAVFDPCITGTPQQAVSDGYWVMIRPLPVGTHTILVKIDIAGQHFETTNVVTIAQEE